MNPIGQQKQSALAAVSEKSLTVIVYSLTIVVVALVSFLIYFPQTLALGHLDVSMLPALNAFINGTCAVLLSAGYVFIRRRNFKAHKTMMLSAFLDLLVLLSFKYYLSIDKLANPDANEFVNLLTELRAPDVVFLNSD